VCVLTYFCIGKVFLSKSNINTYCNIFFGCIIFSALGVIINFFLPLSKLLNSGLTLALILISIFLIKIKKTEIFTILAISLISVILLSFDTVNRPDAYLYHLPYSQILNENKIIIGLSNLHFRFGHVSIFQYLSSLNLNYIANEKGILIPLSIFWTNLFFYFGSEARNLYLKKKYTIDKIFSLIIFLFICTRINRYSEFGNDASGHLAMFYLVSRFLKLKKENFRNFNEIYLYSIFVFLNKTFLIFCFLLPFYLFLKNKYNPLKVFISLPSIILILWLIKNILISGCFIYPLKQSCINFQWTNLVEVKEINTMSEAWSKGWPQNKNKKISQEEFIKNFKWFKSWKKENLKIFIKNYSLLLLIIIILLIVLRYENYENKNININKDKKKLYIILFFSLIGSIFYFLKFPIYRYGYSYFVILISFLFIIFLKLKKDQNIKVLKALFFIGVIVISLKQFQRFINNNHLKIFPNLVYANNLERKKLANNFSVYKAAGECGYEKAPCTSYDVENLKYKSFYSYHVLFKKN